MDEVAMIIGYLVMVAGGITVAVIILFCVLVSAYKMLTRAANSLTNRLVNLHGIESVRKMYRDQENR